MPLDTPRGERRLEYLPVAKITAALRNPKVHDVEAVIRSIGRFGYTEAVLRDERTGRLVAGHGRLEALAAMEAAGESPPDGVRASDVGWQVPVIVGWASRSDAEAEAYLVAANQLSIRGGWDTTELAELLRDLSGQDHDLALDTGFTTSDIDELLAGLRDLGGNENPFTGPGEFPSFDDDIATEHACPKCGYTWSGKSSA